MARLAILTRVVRSADDKKRVVKRRQQLLEQSKMPNIQYCTSLQAQRCLRVPPSALVLL